MWPRVLMQLVELLPHVSRLVPVAERYFSSKAAGEGANAVALSAIAEGVQADLGQVTKAHAGLYRQLQEQGAEISVIRDEVRHVRSAIETSERKIGALEQRVETLNLWVRAGVSAMTVLLLVIVWLLFRK